MNGRRLAASSWFMPMRSRTSRFGASAMGCRSAIASHLAQGDPAKVATGAQRRQRGDGAGRVEDEVPQRRDAAEGREIVLATQPPELHQLEAADLIEDRDVGDRAETAFEPAKPGERAEPLEVDGPDPQALEPDEAAERVDVLPGPVDPESAGAAEGPPPPASRGASACPRARAPRVPPRRGGGRRASSAAANERPGCGARGTSAASRGPAPASTLSWTSGRDDRSSATRGQASSGRTRSTRTHVSFWRSGVSSSPAPDRIQRNVSPTTVSVARIPGRRPLPVSRARVR